MSLTYSMQRMQPKSQLKPRLHNENGHLEAGDGKLKGVAHFHNGYVYNVIIT